MIERILHPDKPLAFSDKNYAAWVHNLECQATNSFPVDGLVRLNAGLIIQATRDAELIQRQRFENRVVLAIESLRPHST